MKNVSNELEEFRDELDVAAVIGAVTDANGLIALDVVGTRSAADPTLATTDDQWHIGSCLSLIHI